MWEKRADSRASQYGLKPNQEASRPGSASAYGIDDHMNERNDPNEGKTKKKLGDWLKSNKPTVVLCCAPSLRLTRFDMQTLNSDNNDAQSVDSIISLRQDEIRRISAKQTKETFSTSDMVTNVTVRVCFSF